MTATILTTHVGSLPRPPLLAERLLGGGGSEDGKAPPFGKLVAAAVTDVVRQQIDVGLDVINDGEMGRTSYTHYVADRLTGLVAGAIGQGRGPAKPPRDMADHPDVAAAQAGGRGTARGLLAPLICEGAVAYRDTEPVKRDIANLIAASTRFGRKQFLSSASPGTLAHFVLNRHYATEDEFVAALADAMQTEYEAIFRAGIVVQIDCPDLAMIRHMRHQDSSDADFIRIAERNVEALNHATRNIPGSAMRMHVCWGNYPGPHTHDFPVAKLIPTLMRARPAAILFEGANPRHEHEWEDWAAASIPDDKILIPGVIDTTTNLVEHPRLVAQRLERYCGIVGPERVMAATDCGFGTVAGRDVVVPSVVAAKLRVLVEGAEIARDQVGRV